VTGSGLTQTDIYNALGQFVEEDTNLPFGYQSDQIFDPAGQWVGQFDTDGDYWWGQYVRLQGRVIANEAEAGTVFMHKDAEGTMHQATAPDQTLLQDQIFYPWGQSWQLQGSWQQQEFADMDLFMVDDGFYRSLSRQYNPNVGRWLSPDPANAGADPSNPQTWNMYAYAGNNPTTNTDPTGETYKVCQTDANGNQSNCTDISDEQFGQFQQENKDTLTFTGNGNVLQNGTVIGSYQQTSVDLNPFASGVIAGVNANRPGDFIAAVAGASVVAGTGVGLGLYATTAGAGLTTLGLQAAPAIAPLLPAVPSAITKLQQLGISLQEAAQIASSPTAQKFIDNAHGGNINVFQNVGDKIIRITLDPSASRIISAGIVQARNVTNSIASGRFTPMQ
jgi:RHS repeat-associated protein